MHTTSSTFARPRRLAAAAVAGFAALLASPALGGDLRIERIVPGETIFAAGTDSFEKLSAAAQSTPAWKFTETDAVKRLIDRVSKQLDAEGETLDDQLKALGLERDDLVPPKGPVGFAAFLENNEDLAIKQPHWLAVADFGDGADKAQKVLDAVFEKLAKDRSVVIAERTIRNRKVRSMPLPTKPEAEQDDFDFFGGMPDLTGHIDAIHLCRDGERIFLASSLVALEDAIEAADGKPLDSPLAESRDFQASLAQLGENRQAWAVILTPAMQPLIAPLMAGPAAMAEPFIGDLFGDIRGYSFGVAFENDERQVRQSIGILIPGEKAGLISLLRESKPSKDVPAHVGPDTIGFSRLNVKFAGVMPIVERIVKGLPPMFAEEAEMQLSQMRPMLEKAFGGMGPELYVVQTLEEPITDESMRMSVLIRNPDPATMRPMLDMFGPMMGVEPQDFVGQTIYADEFADGAIGLGGGWLVIGDQDSVEGVLRATGQKDLPTVKDEPEFRRGIAALPDAAVVGWGWADTVTAWKGRRYESMQNAKMLLEFAEMQGIGLGDQGDDPLTKFVEELTPEDVARYIGPSIWWLQATDDGFRMTMIQLAPKPQ